jgi:lipoprotein-anchoring transpeptidase ErfK/SrfK
MRIGRRATGLLLLALILPSTALAQECANTPDCVEVAAVSHDVIIAYPAPNVIQLQPDDTVIFDRNYQRLTAAVDVYDAPEGNVIRHIAAGFNFVTAGSDQNGWTQINPNEWVRSEFLGGALVSRFSGVFLPEDGLPYPMAWMLVSVVPSRQPGASPVDGDLPLQRYTRVNIYASQEIEGWRWYQVGTDQWVHQTQVAKVIPVERPADVDTERWISVDLYEQVLIAYEGDVPVFATLVSSGLSQWATNEGLFNIYVRYSRTHMSGAEGQEDFYSLEDVPWTMFFDNDIGLHGTYWHDGFGYRHSHGCVNMSIMDAKWVYEWASAEFDFTVDNDLGAAVYVYSSGQYQ